MVPLMISSKRHDKRCKNPEWSVFSIRLIEVLALIELRGTIKFALEDTPCLEVQQIEYPAENTASAQSPS